MVVQQHGDQLLIFPVCHPAQPTMEAPVDGVDADDRETGSDVGIGVDREAVLTANARVKGYWDGMSSMETETLFSQKFILRHRMEDLFQEMISLLSVTSVKQMTSQPVVCTYSTQKRPLHNCLDITRMEEMRSVVELGRNPKDLYTVWKELELG